MKAIFRNLSLCCLSLLVTGQAATPESGPRYPKPVERPRPPVGPDGKPLVTIDGRWYSDFGYMDLEQEQWSFEGTYSCCDGKIQGEFIANQIEFFWEDQIYGKGWGYFRLNDEERLVGIWGGEDDMGSSGPWRAVRLADRAYEGEAATWSFAATHPQLGAVRGRAVLHTSSGRVAGWLEGAADTRSAVRPEGRLYRHEIFRYLEGRVEKRQIHLEWHNPLTDRKGDLSLVRTSRGLDGIWHFAGDAEGRVELRPLSESEGPSR